MYFPQTFTGCCFLPSFYLIFFSRSAIWPSGSVSSILMHRFIEQFRPSGSRSRQPSSPLVCGIADFCDFLNVFFFISRYFNGLSMQLSGTTQHHGCGGLGCPVWPCTGSVFVIVDELFTYFSRTSIFLSTNSITHAVVSSSTLMTSTCPCPCADWARRYFWDGRFGLFDEIVYAPVTSRLDYPGSTRLVCVFSVYSVLLIVITTR